MIQVYHPNALINVHIRRQIKESSLTNFQLAQTFHTSPAYHQQVEEQGNMRRQKLTFS
jgi:hypothetical protein